MTKRDFEPNKKITQTKQKRILMKINEKNYKHLIQGKSHFEEDGAQIYLIFQTMYRYFKKISGVGNGEHVYFLKSKG